MWASQQNTRALDTMKLTLLLCVCAKVLSSSLAEHSENNYTIISYPSTRTTASSSSFTYSLPTSSSSYSSSNPSNSSDFNPTIAVKDAAKHYGYSSPRAEDNGYSWINSSSSANRSTFAAGLDVDILPIDVTSSQQKTMKPVPYQSLDLPVKPKPEKAGSQEAPANAGEGLLTKHPNGKPKKHIFCYYGSSANSRPSLGKFWPEHIDPFLCTHLIFAFVDVTDDGTGIKPNNWNDLGDMGLYTRTMKLKEKNPDLKILLAVGGWKIGSKPFLPVIKSESTWKEWVSNVIVYLRHYNFDGFDMDWEFPAWRGSKPEDKHKFTLLMKELYEQFAEESKKTGKPKLLLSLATASSAFYAEKSYEPAEIHKYIDYMLLMTYNYHGSGWEKETGHHTPLLPHPKDPEGEQRELYILWSVKYWLNFGVPREKMIVGLSTYGLGWKLTDPSNTGVRAPADGGTTKGKYTEESGILSHYEICEHVLKDGWKVEWIEEQKVPYAYGDGEWVGFDSPDSFYLKALTVIKENLAGVFVWSVEMDDFTGHCGGPKYPLLRTIYEVFTHASTVTSNLKMSPSLKSAPAAVRKSHSSAASMKAPPGAHSHDDGHHDHSNAVDMGSTKDDYDRYDYSHYYADQEAPMGGHYGDNNYDHYNDYVYSYEYYGAGGHGGAETHAEVPDYVNCHELGIGIHADVQSCHHFILCMPVDGNKLGPSRMTCPIGTLFDSDLKVCNHEHDVHCDR